MNFQVYYLLQKHANALKIHYRATTDLPTIVNLTNHSYFNLNGQFHTNSILDHKLKIPLSNMITPIDDKGIPYGDYMKVEGTPFDFREFKKIGEGIGHPKEKEEEQIKNGQGYDNNFVIKSNFGYGTVF